MSQRDAEPMGDPGSSGLDGLLDEVFECAVEAFQRGEEPALDFPELVDESLRARAMELVELAREVALGGPGNEAPLPRLAGYEIERELGAGSMGTVYLARQLSLGGRRVALKVLSPSLGISARARSRFLTEAHAVARLSHPGVVAVHDIVEGEGVLAFAMEWVEGCSLLRLVQTWRGRPLDEEQDVLRELTGFEGAIPAMTTWLLRGFADLARALHVVHRAGLLHRDIKPANVLLRSDGVLLLSDFGLVRDVENHRNTRSGQYLGTMAYSSPEQLRGEVGLDERSDVYSLGATLYEALTLECPFRGATSAQLVLRIEQGVSPVPRRRGVRFPRDLETILSKALDPQARRRYASAADLADDLDRLLAFQPILARPTRPWTHVARFVRRNRKAVGAVALTSFVVLIFSMLGARRWVRSELADARAQRAWQRAQVELIDPRLTGLLFMHAATGESPVEFEYGLPLVGRVASAVEAYDRALAHDPSADLASRIAIERTSVALALASQQGSELSLHEGLFERRCPLAATYVRGERPEIDQIATATRLDRRHLGLIAFLLADLDLALAAWEDVADSYPVDPLVDALVGAHHLVAERPHEAFALLRSAFDSFPDVGFLGLQLADAALRTSRTATGAWLLELARDRNWQDWVNTHLRLQADLDALQGDEEAAIRGYRNALQLNTASTIHVHFAHFLESRGDLEGAVWVLDTLNRDHSGIAAFQRELALSTELWWQAQSGPTWQRLRRCLDDPALAVGPFPAFLTRYAAVARDREASAAKMGRIPSPFSRHLPAEAQARSGSLRRLALLPELLAVELSHWRRAPAWMRTAHAMALVSPWPDVLGPLFRGIERAWPGVPGDSPTPRADLPTEGWTSVSGGPFNRRRARGLWDRERWSLAWSAPSTDSPVAARGLVFVRDANGIPGDLIALDLRDGSECWRRSLGPLHRSSRTLACIIGDHLFVTLFRGDVRTARGLTVRVERRDLLDGSLQWTWDSGEDGVVSALQGGGDGLSGVVALDVLQYRDLPAGPPWVAFARRTILDPFAVEPSLAPQWQYAAEAPTMDAGQPIVMGRGEGLEVVFQEEGALDHARKAGGPRSLRVHSVRESLGAGWGMETVAALSGAPASRGEWRAGPVSDGKSRIFLLDSSGHLLAHDLRSGFPLWPPLEMSRSASACTVLDTGSVVVFFRDSPHIGTVSQDGRLTRRIALPDRLVFKGYVLGEDDVLFVATADGWVHSVKVSEGSSRPLFRVPGTLRLAAFGGTLLVQTRDRLFAYR